MSAMLGRIRQNERGLPVSEYLHRDETLFVDPEWSWVAERSAAHIFPDYEAARAFAESHRRPGEYFFPLVCGNPEMQAARERREQERVDTALSSVRETPTPEKEIVSAVPVKRSRGAETWKEIFEQMEAAYPHEEVFGETERRTGS